MTDQVKDQDDQQQHGNPDQDHEKRAEGLAVRDRAKDRPQHIP